MERNFIKTADATTISRTDEKEEQSMTLKECVTKAGRAGKGASKRRSLEHYKAIGKLGAMKRWSKAQGSIPQSEVGAKPQVG